MASPTLHSFVIPAYGASPFLEECIASLRAQEVQSDILVTTSTPNSLISTVCERFGVPVIINPQGGSIAADWNFAFQAATTPYVTLAHQDDVYEPGYTTHCLAAVAPERAWTLVFSDYAELVCTESSRQIRNSNLILVVKRIILRSFFLWQRSLRSPWRRAYVLAFGSPISCPTVMFNKAALPDFAFSSDYAINLDWDAWRRLSRVDAAFVYTGKRDVLHRIYEGSETTRGLESHQRQDEDARIFRLFWPRPIAALLSALYSLSYRSNSLKS